MLFMRKFFSIIQLNPNKHDLSIHFSVFHHPANWWKPVFSYFWTCFIKSFERDWHHDAYFFFKECVPVTIIYYLYFLCISKFQACYITGQWGEFTVKNATLHVLILSWHFFLFLIKKLCFFHFHFVFDEVSNFRNRILTNQKPK